jgi:hypothetical protein
MPETIRGGWHAGKRRNRIASKTQKELLLEQRTMLQDRLEVIDKQ